MGTWTFGDITYLDAEKNFLKIEVCISILLCYGIKCFPNINGEAYPEMVLCSLTDIGNYPRHGRIELLYYVIQVAPGKEAEAEIYIKERISEELYSSCFYLVRHVRKKFRGVWRDKHEKLLPGYVFIDSKSAEELYLDLKRIPIMTKLLGGQKEFITALTEEETVWLEKIVSIGRDGNVNGEVLLSQIEVSENDEVKILSGPLQNMTGIVRRINLHRRIAEVEVEFMGRKTVIYLGIEIINRK